VGIHLDDQALRGRDEVRDEAPNGDLSPEGDAELLAAERAPERRFGQIF
jgi:hypothetical protein